MNEAQKRTAHSEKHSERERGREIGKERIELEGGGQLEMLKNTEKRLTLGQTGFLNGVN